MTRTVSHTGISENKQDKQNYDGENQSHLLKFCSFGVVLHSE